MDRITDERLAELEAIAEAATEGPWHRIGLLVYASMHAGWRKGQELLKNRITVQVQPDAECSEAEAEATAQLIAAARDDLPALVAEVRRLRDGYATAIECLRDLCAALDGGSSLRDIASAHANAADFLASKGRGE